MLGQKYEVGRISGIPIVLDGTFIVLVLLYGYSYFTAGTLASTLMGIAIVVGGIGSILIHELAHAWAGRICRIDTSHIELNGLGGLCYLDRAAHTSRDDIFISLAGPASNLALWALFYWLGNIMAWPMMSLVVDEAPENPEEMFNTPALMLLSYSMMVLSSIASINISMFVFNLMPAFPLDGGRALSAWLSRRMDGAAAKVLVAWLGMAVGVWCLWMARRGNPCMLMLALYLFMANHSVLQRMKNPPWKRWN